MSISGQTKSDSTQIKSNPIIYFEGLFGYAGGEVSGLTIGGILNFQSNKDLFTVRLQNQTKIDSDYLALFPFSALFSKVNIDEFSVLYGKRHIVDNKSYSFSLGLSSNIKHTRIRENNVVFWDDEKYFGIPFEINIKWFKREKKRFRILYGIVPVGKETGFGRSIGFKFYGNIAKTSYIGVGINVGLGWHKKY